MSLEVEVMLDILKNVFIYLLTVWVFIATHRHSLVVESGGYSLVAMCSTVIVVASLGAEHRL